MKRLLILFVTLLLLCVLSISAFGAIHNSWGDFISFSTGNTVNIPSWGGWYYIDKETPYAIANANMANTGELGAIYYQNDQTFAEFNRTDSTITFFKGDYKFDNGLFFGLKHYYNNSNPNAPYYDDLGSVGYAYNFSDNGYVAISEDYFSANNNGLTIKGTAGYGIDFRYYTDVLRTFGQIYEDQSNLWYGPKGLDTQWAVNYKLTDSFVVGGEIDSVPHDSTYSIGGTYTVDLGEFDLRYTREEATGSKISTVDLLGLFNVEDNLLFGGSYENQSPTTLTKRTVNYSLLAKYKLDDKNNLRFRYQFATKNVDSVLTLAYYLGL